jgi:cytochrome c oxidase assembly protein subunit 11
MRDRVRNLQLALFLASVTAGMVALSYAAVPLYRAFCVATGFQGTTRRVAAAPVSVGDKFITVRFDADVSPALPWRFYPLQPRVRVRLGEPTLIYFRAENLARRAVAGLASFNVVPMTAGQYVAKVQCFCFDEQRLNPGEGIDMAVQFYVDPAIAKDADLHGVDSITLSYTFFHAAEDQPAAPAAKLSGLPIAPNAVADGATESGAVD